MIGIPTWGYKKWRIGSNIYGISKGNADFDGTKHVFLEIFLPNQETNLDLDFDCFILPLEMRPVWKNHKQTREQNRQIRVYNPFWKEICYDQKNIGGYKKNLGDRRLLCASRMMPHDRFLSVTRCTFHLCSDNVVPKNKLDNSSAFSQWTCNLWSVSETWTQNYLPEKKEERTWTWSAKKHWFCDIPSGKLT